MIPTEINLAVQALRWRKGYSDSNPDVGMGPFIETLASEILDAADIEYTDTELKFIIKQVKRMERR